MNLTEKISIKDNLSKRVIFSSNKEKLLLQSLIDLFWVFFGSYTKQFIALTFASFLILYFVN